MSSRFAHLQHEGPEWRLLGCPELFKVDLYVLLQVKEVSPGVNKARLLAPAV